MRDDMTNITRFICLLSTLCLAMACSTVKSEQASTTKNLKGEFDCILQLFAGGEGGRPGEAIN